MTVESALRADALDAAREKSVATILATEARIWLLCAVGTFVLASVLVTGWPGGLVPNLSYPYRYDGDMLVAFWIVQNLIEGNWIFHTDRSGYPFGTDLLDYPLSDSGSLAILGILGQLTGSYWATVNLFFLLGFPVTFLTSYVVMRSIRISVSLAAAGSLLFTLLPYHFQRLDHLFLTWYFVAPVYFLFGWWLYSVIGRQPRNAWTRRAVIGCAVSLLICASFGIYYAVFGTIVLLVSGLGGWLRTRSIAVITALFAAVSLTALGATLNMAPNLVHIVKTGRNTEAARREIGESEVYGLKIVQMLLPRADHRITAFGATTRRYNDTAPLINENQMSTLGVVGAAGLLLLGAVVCVRVTGCTVDERLAFLALIVLCVWAIASVGGLSALFATLISPQLRGWNRASIFIAFAAIAGAMITLEWLLTRCVARKRLVPSLAAAGTLIAVIGSLDQTASPCEPCNQALRSAFEQDREFNRAIETSLPARAAIYQLPYIPFPEPANYRLIYEQMSGAINSKQLRWSYGTMKGREGDLFFRALAKWPLEAQLDVLRRLAFSGIYVDRRGYDDDGRAIEATLRKSTGAGPAFVRSDNRVAFYRLGTGTPALPAGLSATRVTQAAGIPADMVYRYAATPEEGVDLRREALPQFVAEIKGLSAVESWGRWSDDKLRRNVLIRFREPLPRKFTLALRGQAFGPNAGLPVLIRIGGSTGTISLAPGMEERRVTFNLGDRDEREIEIVPPQPIAPADLSVSRDTRRLGIGFERIWFER